MSAPLAEKFQFCSEATSHIQEPLGGTAPSVKYWVAVSWPKTLWHSKALKSKGLPTSLAEWQQQQNSKQGKTALRLISRPEATTEVVDIFIYPGNQHYTKVPIEKLETVLTNHFEGVVDTNYLQTTPQRPQLFVCTHGKHDKCCAKFGQAVFKQFRHVIEEKQLDIDLWEGSHIGGHRFAATAITFPSGHVYGRMTLEDVIPVLEHIEQNRVYTPKYRGQCFFSSPEQAAEAHVHRYGFDNQKYYDSCVIQEPVASKETFQCVIQTSASSANASQQQFKIILSRHAFSGPGSCGELENDTYETRWRWIPTSIEINA